MQQIIPGLYTFTGLMAGRAYAIEDADGLTLIDTSITPAGPKILQQLAAAGHQPNAVKRILITHAHPDHVGSLPFLQEKTGAQVRASALEAEVIEGKKAIPRRPSNPRPPQTQYPGSPVDRLLADGDVLAEVMGGLQAVFTPGHAPGHLAFWQPDKKVLFCGDTIFRIPFNMRLPYAMLTVDMAENIRAIGRLASLNPDIICFGHGKPLQENSANLLRQFAQKVGQQIPTSP
jgi:glyoxylase-like metal-dependent hydrolase (beta-lactamase superfamily II)